MNATVGYVAATESPNSSNAAHFLCRLSPIDLGSTKKWDGAFAKSV
jgi:hypothetical protein